jgi:hypothetical protein
MDDDGLLIGYPTTKVFHQQSAMQESAMLLLIGNHPLHFAEISVAH